MSPTLRLPHRSARGFTLIELLIVISILGLLAAVLLPQIFGVSQQANVSATEANLLQLQTACDKFQRAYGYYPPDDLRWPEAEKAAKTAWKADNGTNTGIESFLVFVSQTGKGSSDLGSLAESLANTDEDTHGAEIPELHRSDRPEIVDAWKVPLAYFTKFGMDKAQRIQPPDQDLVTVRAKKREGNVYFGQNKFQFLSAGPDSKFGTEDDIVWPQN